jgi:hypothetical protein
VQDTARPDGPPETGAAAPLLSIGLAVYNGERHLAQAIDSLLAQDVGDFELIISDNASTDATESICREYVAADPRIRYVRNAENIGAAANYNRVFELSTGGYFMWGSDDDVWDPRFASACIAKLEDSPLAVQCTSRIALIGEDGGPVSYAYEPLDTEGMPVEARAHELVSRIRWYEIYSVFRPSVLRETGLFRAEFGGDVCLLMELCLLGEFVTVPQTLLSYRLQDTPKTADELVAEIGSDTVADLTAPTTAAWTGLARALLGVVAAADLDSATISRIREDIASTLSLENHEWRTILLDEGGLNESELLRNGTMESTIRERLQLEPVDGAPASAKNQPPWRMRDGVRLAAIRRALLRLLQPFGDRQNEVTARQAESAERLRFELERLERRIRELERRA